MPDDKRSDTFKPAQPFIPGVPAEAAKSTPQVRPESPSYPEGPDREARPQRLTWLTAVCSIGAAFVVGAGLVGSAFLLWHHMSSLRASEQMAEPAMAAAPLAAEPVKTTNLATGPGPIATTVELAKPWASKRFLFPDSVTAEALTAMVVHLPNGSYWAFSLKEPFGSCALDYVTDLEKLRDDYNFAASHPMVVDTCNRTVYDLLRYGGPSDNSLVRGDVVQGPGLRPPIAIEVRVEGNHVVAVRME